MGYRTFVPALLSLLPFVTFAETGGMWDSLQIHGFASQAMVKTSDNRFFGDSPDVSFDFTEIGVNASLRPHSKLLLSAQLMARRAGDIYEGDVALDYALVDWTAFSSEHGRFGARAGRLKNPLGLYNETRDVPFTRPGIFLPQVIYFDKVRNLVLSTDGALAYGDWLGDFGSLSATLTAGQTLTDENVEWAYLGNDFPGDVEPDGTSFSWSLWYSTLDERIKLGWSGAVFTFQYDPAGGVADFLAPGTTDVLYWIASFQYNAEDWTVSAEYMRQPIEWQDYGLFSPDRDATGEGYYLQGAYRLRPDVEFMLRWEEGFADTADRRGQGMEASSGGYIPAFAGYSRIWTAGVRWDVNRHLMLRAEYQRHNGAFVLSFKENDPPDLVKHWDLFALQVSVRF